MTCFMTCKIEGRRDKIENNAGKTIGVIEHNAGKTSLYI
jgi:hypothetical protein